MARQYRVRRAVIVWLVSFMAGLWTVDTVKWVAEGMPSNQVVNFQAK